MSNPTLSVQINGETHCLPEPCSVSELLERFELGERRVAVAINAHVIPKSAFQEHLISAGDHIEILHAVGGG